MFLDTSAWIELRAAGRPERARQVWGAIGGGPYHCSPIQFGEMADIAIRRGEDVEEFCAGLTAAVLIPLSASIAAAGARIKAEARLRATGQSFSIIDGILLASARATGVPFVTCDNDFAGFDDCVVLGHWDFRPKSDRGNA